MKERNFTPLANTTLKVIFILVIAVFLVVILKG